MLLQGLPIVVRTLDRVLLKIFPNGTTPDVILNETDVQTVWGLKGDDVLGWAWDASSSYGKNTQDHSTRNNLNPSLGPSSPTSFGLQNTMLINGSLTLTLKNFRYWFGANPLSVAWGLDYRKEG